MPRHRGIEKTPLLQGMIRAQITHEQVDLLRPRMFGLALGYEDLNDHDTLRKDGLSQTTSYNVIQSSEAPVVVGQRWK